MKILFIFIFAFLNFFQCTFAQFHKTKLEFGADQLLSNYLYLIKGKRIALVTNQTGVLANGNLLLDTLIKIKNISVEKIFSPEHGYRGVKNAGEKVESSIDSRTGIPVVSLYGKIKKPAPEMLKNIDLILYDLQDVGSRYYTYISTLFKVMQAAAENDIPLIVLDRPDPINAKDTEGPVLKKEFESFVGIAQIPIRYGMTPGELAEMFAGSKWLGHNLKLNLTVIKMKGFVRDLYYGDYDLSWISPSPNMPYIESALVYPGTCLLEATNVSEGRGTYYPFTLIGAPFINAERLIEELNKHNMNGLQLTPTVFTPIDIPSSAKNPKYKGQVCNGISIEVKDRRIFHPVRFGLILISSLAKLYPRKFKIFTKQFDRLSGDSSIRKFILQDVSPEKIISTWQKELNRFDSLRKKYLLY